MGNDIKITTPVKLNSKWAIAIVAAASDLKPAAISAVKVVPTFAPIIKVKAFLNFILSAAAKGTKIEVVTELD